ncbi:MAG: sugar transferase [Verrucomicrobiota bacterium]|nr:sugar transferase [Verrucomicrobiota bacterium]
MAKPKLTHREVVPLLVFTDTVAGLAGTALAYLARSGYTPKFHEEVPMEANYALLAVVLTLFSLLSMRFFGLYGVEFLTSRRSNLVHVGKAISLAVFCFFAASYLFRAEQTLYSRFVLFLSIITITCLIALLRTTLFWLHKRFELFPSTRTLIIGWNAVTEKLLPQYEVRAMTPVMVAGILCQNKKDISSQWRHYYLGELNEADDLLKAGAIDELLIVGSQIDPTNLARLCRLADQHFIHVTVIPDVFEILLARLKLDQSHGIPLLSLGDLPLDFWTNRLVKRLLDILGGVVGLLLSLIPGLIIAMAVKRESPGRIFFTQERIGKRGRKFKMIKFRTMNEGSESQDNTAGLGLKNDPRITHLGEFLRKNNLDELPQFWNVIKGDMSLVGPRPERTFYVEKFKNQVPHYMPRHYFKPGLTGLAQIRGYRGDTSLEARITSDLEYLENWTFFLDLHIMGITFLQMCRLWKVVPC